MAAIVGLGCVLAFYTPAISQDDCLTARANSARAGEGAGSLKAHPGLAEIAQRHSAAMAADKQTYHNSRLADEAPPGHGGIAENVGQGKDCDEMHTAFMDSPAHRRNIMLASFNNIGVGVAQGEGGYLFVTQVFASYPEEAPAPQPSPSPTITFPPKLIVDLLPVPLPPPLPPAPLPPPPPEDQPAAPAASEPAGATLVLPPPATPPAPPKAEIVSAAPSPAPRPVPQATPEVRPIKRSAAKRPSSMPRPEAQSAPRGA